MACASYIPVYQSGMTIPFGLSVCADSVKPRVTRRTPSISERMIRWPVNDRCRASLQAAMKPPLPVALRTSIPDALKMPLPAALSVPRRCRPRFHQTPAFASDTSVVLEKVSFVEYAGSFHQQRAQHAACSLIADVPKLDKSNYSGRSTATKWHHVGDNEYQQSEPQSLLTNRTIHSQFGGARRKIVNVSKGAETSITIDGKNCYALKEANSGCVADNDPAAGNVGVVTGNGCPRNDGDGGGDDWDDGCQTCSEVEEEEKDDVSCSISEGGGSDEKTREAVANLLAVMTKERRNRKRRRRCNGRASRRLSTRTRGPNETGTVNKLLSFTRMRCPYQEYPRACQTVTPPDISCSSHNKSVFWASDDYIQETSHAVKVLLEKY